MKYVLYKEMQQHYASVLVLTTRCHQLLVWVVYVNFTSRILEQTCCILSGRIVRKGHVSEYNVLCERIKGFVVDVQDTSLCLFIMFGKPWRTLPPPRGEHPYLKMVGNFHSIHPHFLPFGFHFYAQLDLIDPLFLQICLSLSHLVSEIIWLKAGLFFHKYLSFHRFCTIFFLHFRSCWPHFHCY